jgi:hypothetical protein
MTRLLELDFTTFFLILPIQSDLANLLELLLDW